MSYRAVSLRAAYAVIFVASFAGFAASAQARSDEPSSGTGKCSNFEPGSRGWRKCMGQVKPDAEEAYALGYWLAKTGDFAEALVVLRERADQNDPRVLTMIGFATRHLGRVDEALGYYEKALAANPDATTTRQYLGEAFLQKGEPDKAREQLAEIAARGGAQSEDYVMLAAAIESFERNGKT